MILKTLSKLALALAFVLAPSVARAACATIPYTFTDATSLVAAATTNANNTSLYNCATTVDRTQIGPTGIRASQVIPDSTGAATFGGTLAYSFPQGLNVNGALLTANSGLTVVGTTNLAATTFSAPPTMSGANITAGTIPISALTGVLPIANGGTGSATQNFVDLTTAQTVAGTKVFSAPIVDQANGLPTYVAGNNAQVLWNCSSAGGEVCLLSAYNGGTTAGFYHNNGSAFVKSAQIASDGTYTNAVGAISPATYSQTGGAVASFHIVQGTALFSGVTNVSITFSGTAVFSSVSSYACFADGNQSNNAFWFNQANGSTTTINAGVSVSSTIPYVCMGT